MLGAILGCIDEPLAYNVMAAGGGNVLFPELHRARIAPSQAENRFCDFGPASAYQSGETQDLALVQSEAHVAEARFVSEALHAQNRRLRRVADLATWDHAHLAADHLRQKSYAIKIVALDAVDQRTVAKNADVIGDIEHLIHAVADEAERITFAPQPAHGVEQTLDLMSGQR